MSSKAIRSATAKQPVTILANVTLNSRYEQQNQDVETALWVSLQDPAETEEQMLQRAMKASVAQAEQDRIHTVMRVC